MWRLCLVLIVASGPAMAASPTFTHDVAPLVYAHCAPCHHPGGAGPFPLLSYADVRKHARQIVAVTGSRYMPPWPPQPGIGVFRGDRHLSLPQIQLLADWVQAGTPEGSGTPPIAPVYKNDWQMGMPDLILRMEKAFPLRASGEDMFRNFVIASNLPGVRYVRGFELRLNNKRAVHHANVVLDRTRSLRRRDGEDGAPGFPGMDVTTEAAPDEFDPDSHFLFWKPASVLAPEPDDMSWRLDPGTDLILNLHLQPTGKPESIEAEIGLYFANAAPTRKPMLLQLEHDGDLRIPPGVRDFTVEDHLVLPVGIQLLAIYPHAHYLGKVIEAWGTLPDGQRRDLIRIPDWDINWQATYEYRQPIALPKGTRLAMRIQYDNSSQNPRNPTHPPVLVTAGNRSRDEMGHVWLQVLPDPNGTGDPRWALQEAAMARRLEKYPNDFLASYNLGALLQTRGRLPEAQDAYRRALALEPDNATVHNSLGSTYLALEEYASAIPELRRALALNPDYQNARYNLARALAANGDSAGALRLFEAYLRVQPDDVDGHKAAAALYLAAKDYTRAAAHLGAAVKLVPQDAELQANWGAVLAMSGNLNEAIAALESALRLQPDNAMAAKNLARARTQLQRATR